METLLRIRRKTEDGARQAMIAADGKAAAVGKRILLLRESLAECNAAARQSLMEGAVVNDTNAYRKKIGRIRAELVTVAGELSSVEENVTHRRLELAQAIKLRRAMETLAKKQAVVEIVARRQREQKEMDEVYASVAG